VKSHSPVIHEGKMPVATVISEQGARAHMEDSHFLDPDFDGKGITFTRLRGNFGCREKNLVIFAFDG
jgi:L-amino acid N-acyltransferase YncA